MTVKQALELVGGLSAPSKMPCYGYSIPARHCKQGMKMRDIEGSICSKCYALKGRYAFDNVQNAFDRRFDSLQHPEWVATMAFLILKKEKSGFFRWHDSGDLQGQWHLSNIAQVAALTPHIQHWLPTREYAMVREWLANNDCPPNLVIRLSALMFDGKAPEGLAKRLGVQVSGASASAFTCPASKQENKCGDCRACWDGNTFNVSYKKH